MKKRVVVIGGGLAGMTAAYELAKTGEYEPILLERGGHLGGKVMSSEGYGGLPIEHGVHGWWKGYANFFDVLRELHGEGFEDALFNGPHFSRFTARLEGGRIVTMNRPPPLEGEPRVMPFVRALLAMVEQRALSYADVASLVRLLARMIAFDHRGDYARFRDVTAAGMCDALGVSKRAQELVVANFTLASAFSPLDRVSASALLSSAAFYIFDAEASLASRWLRTHPAKVVHAPLSAAIEAHGGEVCRFARVLGLARGKGGRVDTVYVDRAHTGVLDARDVGHEDGAPRDLFDDRVAWRTARAQLALARATLRHLEHVWLASDRRGDAREAAGEGSGEAIAWSGEATRPATLGDPRWLKLEWSDDAGERVRILEDRWHTVGTIHADDVPENAFRELLWSAPAPASASAPASALASASARPLRTPPEALAHLREGLARHAHLLAMHASDLTSPPHLPLYVGKIDGQLRAFVGICTHLGGRLRYDGGLRMFACQLHGSRFACDGQRVCGPAEADLLAFRLAPSARPGLLDVKVRSPPRIHADHVVLATDVRGLQQILQASPSLHDATAVHGMMRLRTTSVTVVRLVLGRRIDDVLAVFTGFRTLDALFNVTKLQGVQLDGYRNRVHEVIELQIYRDRTIGDLAREELMRMIRADLKEAFRWDEEPEILEPVHVAVHRNVYSAFDPESEESRPSTEAGIAGLTFAGDWVHPDEAAWYMERAVRTGRLAARAIVREGGGDETRVPLVAPVREAWNLRTLARAGARGMAALETALAKILGLNQERSP